MAQLVPDKVYLPNGGLNSDGGGIAVQENELIDVENLRINSDSLETRGGSKRLALNAPGGDPIIHQHRYQRPGNADILFGFTKNDIWRYNSGDNDWTSVLDSALLDAADSLSTWSYNAVPVAGGDQSLTDYRVEGTKAVNNEIYDSGTNGQGDCTVTFGTAQDVSSYNSLRYYASVTSSTDDGGTISSTFDVTFKDSSGVTIDSGTVSPSTSGYAIVTFDISGAGSGGGWADLKSITWAHPGVTAAGTNVAYNLLIDYIHVTNPLASDITYWSTTDYLDADEGLTVIAACSEPPLPGNEEADQAKRALYYYDTTDEVFKTLVTKQRTTTTNEDTGVNVPASPGTATSSGALTDSGDSNFTTLVGEGLCSFYTLEEGLLATASAILISDVDGSGNAGYFLIPANTDVVESGSNSWVRQDGLGWSIEFSAVSDIASLSIYVEYTWFETKAYKPRYVAAFHNHLMMMNTFEDSAYKTWRVRWGRPQVKEEATQLDYQDVVNLDSSPIVGYEFQSLYLIVYKRNSKARFYHTQGEVPETLQDETISFNFEPIAGAGLNAFRTIAEHEGIHYYLGKDDVYADFGDSRISITRNNTGGYGRVREEIFTKLNQGKILNFLGFIYPYWKQYWLGIVESGETYPTLWFVYDIDHDNWTKYRYSAITSVGFYQTTNIAQSQIQDLVGTIDEQNWNFLSGAFEGMYATPTLAYSAGDVHIIDERLTTDGGYTDTDTDTWVAGSAISSYFVTRDFISSDLARRERITRMKSRLNTAGDFTVRCSADQETVAGTMRQAQTITAVSRMHTYNYNPDIVSQHLRFRLDFTKHVLFKWLQPFLVRHRLYSE